jgi:hypothetical protein
MFKVGDVITYQSGSGSRRFKIKTLKKEHPLSKYLRIDMEIVQTSYIGELVGNLFHAQLIDPTQWIVIPQKEHNHPLTKIFK